MLLRWLYGDEKVWSVVRVPTEEEEDRRQLHRELNSAKRDRARLTNRIKGLLFAQGIYLAKLQDLLKALPQLRTWSGKALPERLMQRLQREWEKVEQLQAQIRQLDAVRRRMLKKGQDTGTQCARKLFALRGIGMSAAWLFALEFYAWREFKNVRQIGSLAGLTPTPYQSGKDGREQGIDKSGNRWIRALAIEIAWGWLRYQPESELSRWYACRFARGGPRMRRVGIVALARKLLIELWKYLETGTPPAGAQFKAA
jgi:transposase